MVRDDLDFFADTVPFSFFLPLRTLFEMLRRIFFFFFEVVPAAPVIMELATLLPTLAVSSKVLLERLEKLRRLLELDKRFIMLFPFFGGAS